MWSSLSHIISRATYFDWLLLVAGVLFLLYIVGTWNHDYFSRRGMVVVKSAFPFVGHSFNIILGLETVPDFVKRTVREAKGHSVIGFYEFQNPIFLVKSPELIRLITVKQFDHFVNRRGFLNENADSLFGKSLFNLKDQRWRDMRTTLSPAFTTSKIKGMFSLVSECAQQMVEHLHHKFSEKTENEERVLEIDMKDFFTRMANDVIATVAFGLQCDSLKQKENEFYVHGKLLTNITFARMIYFIVNIVFPKLVEVLKLSFLDPKATSFFHTLVHETIGERKRRGIFRPDMLQLLIQAREGNLKAEKEDQHESESIGNNKRELSDEDVTAQAILFFFAGFETVSTALCFSSYEIAQNPDVQRRLQEEVDAVWEKNGGKPTYEDVQEMKYLEAVISEALRMHPSPPVLDRECQEDITLPAVDSTPAFTIRKGQIVTIPTFGIHHDEDLWPDPERFDPERFSDENKHNIKPFSYMPFGLGPRICIGQRYAIMEMKIILAYLLRNFQLDPSPKTKYPLRYTKDFIPSIQGGFWIRISPRNV